MNDRSKQGIREEVESGSGYSSALTLTSEELSQLRGSIEEQWRTRLSESCPELASEFIERGMERYHELAGRVDHSALWPKRERILPTSVVSTFRKTSLVAKLEDAFGPFSITGEDGYEEEEFYWRIVRPNTGSDIGPVHADAWFWELGHGECEAGSTRVKVWIAIICEAGKMVYA